MAKITAIKITRGTRAASKPLAAGKTYKVPGDVSQADAQTLVQMGKAEDASKAGKAKASPPHE